MLCKQDRVHVLAELSLEPEYRSALSPGEEASTGRPRSDEIPEAFPPSTSRLPDPPKTPGNPEALTALAEAVGNRWLPRYRRSCAATAAERDAPGP